MSQSFKLDRTTGMPVSDEELLADLLATAKALGRSAIGMRDYQEHGSYAPSTVARRFGSWNAALARIGMEPLNETNLTDEALFENLLMLWQHYGRQPRRRELALEPSAISQTPYNRRFRSWSGALKAFVEYANTTETVVPSREVDTGAKRSPRDPSLRLRWRVLQRDNFRCCCCGASPAISPGVLLRVDHILAWSNGGDTVFSNLQTLCDRCNLGKSNL